MELVNYVAAGLVAGLYILGTYQGGVIADVVEEAIGQGHTLTPGARFILKWCWPYATVLAMWNNDDGE